MDELYIGLMSGTSVDGTDAALVDFSDGRTRVIATSSTDHSNETRESLLALTRPGDDEIHRSATLDSALARVFAQACNDLINQAGVKKEQVRAIGSHGQTIRHAPDANEPYTVQIGNPSLIAELTGVATVADFRSRDMAAGGQAAPLAPAFHSALFGEPGIAKVVINIGGISNISILPAGSDEPLRGFDCGPGNALMDLWIQRHQGASFDRDGAWAEHGQVNAELLQQFLTERYLERQPPKSTGRELFHLDWLDAQLGGINPSINPEDVQRTLAAFTASCIAQDIKRYAPETSKVLVSGGGAFNSCLMQELAEAVKLAPVTTTADEGIDPNIVEAIGFAWLARQTMKGLPGNCPAVTGAKGPRILGGIYPA